MNKGLDLRNQKLEKKRNKRFEVKENQVGVERKVLITYIELKRLGLGKYVSKKRIREGLQKENRVYFEDGTFVYINKKGTRIKVID